MKNPYTIRADQINIVPYTTKEHSIWLVIDRTKPIAHVVQDLVATGMVVRNIVLI